MRASAIAIAVIIAACWREGPGPAPPPLRPEPPAPAQPAQPRSQWRQSEPVATAPPQPAKSPAELARQLANDLRASGDQLMPAYVMGPIVVLDLDAGTLTVECDSAAATLASHWGLAFTDPKSSPPHCRASQAFTCSQFSSQQVIIVELADPDQWRIVSAIVGNLRSGRAALSSKIGQMRSMIGTAACP